MTLADDVDLEEYIMAKDDLSGADIKAVCTEAGLLALRERRMRVTKADFTSAREKASVFRVNGSGLNLPVLNRFFTGKMKVCQRACTYDRIVYEYIVHTNIGVCTKLTKVRLLSWKSVS